MIHIKCFAHVKEKIGSDEITVNYQKVTVGALLQELAERYQFSKEQIMVAVNEEYAYPENVVHAGDTVALIPPVSGG
ncbi:molybdopterin converting factor subunit 1 [Shouchella shacheensis]|uniref:molybdopterin converting factor subunit 1 n=1 Tax=Shouchella shacheensis TaxID=1649580 RepID=UPI000740556E|nr:molybdopterin converting factor subunit 1 [Shouchella shacheensis]